MIKQRLEIPIYLLNNLLIDENFKKLQSFDFPHYEQLLRLLSGHKFEIEKEFIEYKKKMLHGITKGNYPPPILQEIINGNFVCLDGRVRLLTFKVLGIDPYVEVIYENGSSDYHVINNQRLALKPEIKY